MKKMFFLVAILFATASLAQFADQKEMTLNPGETGKVTTKPCPNEVGKILPISKEYLPVSETKKLIPPKKDWRKWQIITPTDPVGIQNSFNITTNTTNNYYPTPLRNPDMDNRYFYGNDWLVPMLVMLIIAGLIFALFYFNRNNQNPANPVTIHVPPNPPAPRPAIIVPVSENELKDGLDRAQSSGAAFMRHKDGAYSINFPKPPAEEKKSEEKKEGSIDLKKDDKKSSGGGGAVMG